MQESRHLYITSLAAEVETGVIGAINIHAAKAKLDMLKRNWEKFEADHEKLISLKSDALSDHNYFKTKWYDEAMQAFVKAEAALTSCVPELEAMEPPAWASLADVSI